MSGAKLKNRISCSLTYCFSIFAIATFEATSCIFCLKCFNCSIYSWYPFLFSSTITLEMTKSNGNWKSMNSHHIIIILNKVTMVYEVYSIILILIQSCSYITLHTKASYYRTSIAFFALTLNVFLHSFAWIIVDKFAERKNRINYFIYKMIDRLFCVTLLGYTIQKQWNPFFFPRSIFFWIKLYYSLYS